MRAKNKKRERRTGEDAETSQIGTKTKDAEAKVALKNGLYNDQEPSEEQGYEGDRGGKALRQSK